MSSSAEKQLSGCLALLQWQQEVRQAQTLEQLSFIMVNRTMTILKAETIVFWRGMPGAKGIIDRVSGVAQLDANAPFMVWMQGFLQTLAASKNGNQTHMLNLEENSEELPEQAAKAWREWSPPFALWLPIRVPDGHYVGGVWLVREQCWQASEMAMADMLAQTFGHAWMALENQKPLRLPGKRWSKWWSKRWLYRLILVAMFALAWLPVQQSVLAPATVVAQEPLVVTAPLEGVIQKITVSPNAEINAGEILFQMEQTKIRNRRDVAERALHVDQERYYKAQKVSFADPAAKTSLPLLRAIIKQRLSEFAYAGELLERTVIRSEQAGVAIFNNPGEWQGRPVVKGERVMMIADPNHTELEIFLPVEDAIIMQPGVDVFMFLNIDPFKPLLATLRYAAYEAETTPSGILAYRLTAYFVETNTPPRIGLKGMAKLLGKPVPLYYYLFRRPLTALRQAVGF